MKGLQVTDVSHRYGPLEAVRDASLHVAAGHVHCLLGESGSGKSTLLRIIAGLETAYRGNVSIDGKIIAGRGCFTPPERRSIGFVFQDFALFPHLSVIKNVMFGMSGGTRTQRHNRAISLLESVELVDSAEAYPHTLSGGMQQRVALVRALARKPTVMLLDEPFSGLDPRLRSEVREITLRVLRESNVATLLVTHDPRESLIVGDRLSVIRAGRIVQSNEPLQVYRHPVDETTARMFGPINEVRHASERPELLRPEMLVISSKTNAVPISGSLGSGRVVGVRAEGETILFTVEPEDGLKVYVRALAPTQIEVGDDVQIGLRNIAD